MLPGVHRSYNTPIIAVVHGAKNCRREGNHSLVGMDVRTPPMPYFSPGHAFVVGAVKSHVTAKDNLWIGGIDSERREANTVGVGANVSPGKAIRLDLNPGRPAVYRFVQVMVRVARSQKVKHGVDHA